MNTIIGSKIGSYFEIISSDQAHTTPLYRGCAEYIDNKIQKGKWCCGSINRTINKEINN